MSRKLIGIIIILGGIILCVGIVYIVFLDGFSFYNKSDNNVKEEGSANLTDDKKEDIVPAKDGPEKIIFNDNSIINTDNNKPEEDIKIPPRPTTVSKDDLSRMAGSFAERFGSYSNQSNFSNIRDLKLFMSQRMKKWADLYIAEQRGNNIQNEIYYGIITKAVTEEVLDIDDYVGEAAIKVRTRRREATGTTNNTTKSFDQTVIINFIKEAGAWKVDSATWQ